MNRVDRGIWEWIKREEERGNIFPGDDGFYVWDPSDSPGVNRGFLNEYALLEMAKYLQARNAHMQWQHEHDPAIGGADG